MVASRWSSLLLLSLLLCSAWAQDNCGSIGSSDESELNDWSDERFYLNTENPAPCTGNITSWRVCYYGPGDSSTFRSYLSVYAVYRRMGSGSSERYERVSEIFTAQVATSAIAGGATVDAVVQQDGFTCFDDSTDSPVMVQAGDIVGACVFRPPDFSGSISTRQLNVVGEINGESLEEMSDVSGCDRGAIPSNIQTSDLSTRNSRRLHIYANIVSESTQQPTEATVNTTTPNMSGTTARNEITDSMTTAVADLPGSTTTETSESVAETTPVTELPTSTTTGPEQIISGAVAIGAGSAGGVVLLLIMMSATFIAVCFWLQKHKNRRAYFMRNPVQSDTKSPEDDIIMTPTTINAAYKPSQPPLELDVVYDTANEGDYEVPDDSGPVSLERNVAYVTTNRDPTLSLSTSANVAYIPSNTQQGMNATDDEHDNENYDYI